MRYILSLPLAFLLVLAGRVLAQDPSVRYLDTEATMPKDHLLVRGAVEITSEPHRWYGIFFQLRLDASTPLRLADGRTELLKLWSDLFMPENVSTARWTDCRGGWKLQEIEQAVNLPRRQRTVLWAQCDVWDRANSKWIGSGWETRAPVILTTDAAGKITTVEFFRTAPLSLKESGGEDLKVKEIKLALSHLKLKPAAKVYRALGLRHDPHDILVIGDAQTDFHDTARGAAFEPIDSPQKALELAQLAYGGAALIDTPQQYQAIVAELKQLDGWQAERFLLHDRSPGPCGATVTEEPGLGYRVTMLMADHEPLYDLGFRRVMFRQFAIGRDGRMGMEETVCIRCPASPVGAPPMWEPEFGPKRTTPAAANPLEPGGSAPVRGMRDERRAIRAWNDALKAGLGRHASIPQFLTVTETRATIKCAKDSEARWFIGDYDRWP